jgi:two-component system, sensor histidine kinase PdtaS
MLTNNNLLKLYLKLKQKIMQNNKKYIFSLFGFLFFNLIFSQNNKKIDSLEIEILKKQNDTTLINNYYLLAKEFKSSNLNKTNEINNKIWKLSTRNNFEKGFGHFFLTKSYVGLYTQKTQIAILNAQKASKIYLKVKDTAGFLNANYTLSYALYQIDKFDKSIRIANTAINFLNTKNFKYQIGKLNFSLASNYFSKNDLEKSLINYKLAFFNYRTSKVNDKLFLIACYSEIAKIYQKTNQLNKAKESVESAINYTLTNNLNESQISHLYSILGSIYYDQKNYKKAFENVQLAIKKNNSNLNKSDFISYSFLISKIYLKQKKIDLSIKSASQTIRLCNEEIEKSVGYQILGNCYFAKSQISKAPDYQENGMELIENEKFIYLKKALEFQNILVDYIQKSKDKEIDQITFSSIYEEIAKTENALGNYQNAYEYSLLNKQINDKILNKEKTNRINELQTSFEVSEKEIALKNSLFEKQKKDIEIQKQNNYITKISIVLIALILIALILIVNYFVNRKKNIQLQSKNKIIENTNSELNQSKIKLENLISEKDILLKEIHHRVKNNLQIIISLLNIQSRSGKNISTDEFIERSLTRITSMSLVHQNLYQNENVDKVDLNEYLNNLTQFISNSFSETQDRIKVSICCDNIFLQIETAIPLGLIINELMYNMYKHAFPESMNGKIKIGIKKENDNYLLNVKDNGVGFIEDKNSNKSMGLKLVKLLSSQINGTFEKIKSEKTEFHIRFSEENKTN